jgi:lysyl endopeptidase
MNKIIFILVIFMFCGIASLKAQLQPGECGIMFTYDASGSLIKREFICNNTGVVMNRQAKGTLSKNDSINSVKNGISEEEIIKVNAIMPNPTTGRFTVTLSRPINNATVMLLNANGSVIENRKHSGRTLSFDISNRSSGIYFVRIEYEETVLTFKVIKQ